ncbi:MAG TPA: two-component regulator propeller domain-containing protein [Ignavibacteriaceae bacterium]|nr:two-component regulator propeller domain-containing protein [Ignavibacteriaceae bacterium]
MKTYLKILFLALVCSYQSFQQNRNIQFEHLTVDVGLSYNTIFSVIQDRIGFLWIGTYDGLNRYDGYEFKIYKNIPEDSTSISDNMIRALHEDSYGNIWVGCGWGGGLNKFDRATEKFTRYLHEVNNPASLSSNSIYAICSDTSGNLWIGTNGGGLDYFDFQSETFLHYKNDPADPYSLSSNFISAVYVDRNGILWVGTSASGLNKFDKEKKQFTVYKAANDPEGLSGNNITSIYEDPYGILWIGTRDGGLNKFDPYINKFQRFTHDPKNSNSLSSNDVWTVFADTEGLLWIGDYNGGLNLFDTRSESFKLYKKNINDNRSLTDDVINSICEDKSGIIWFGTWSGGLNKYDRKKEKFITYNQIPGNTNSLIDNYITAINKDKDDELWVGTVNGLSRINEKDNRFKHYKHNPSDPGSISGNYIASICEDKEGYLWIATDDAGLNRFDKQKNKFRHFKQDPNDPNSLSDNKISQIFCDSYGDLWIGFSNGMDRLKKGENKFIHYRNNPSNPKSITSQIVFTFYEDKYNNLWIGTHVDGLMQYNRETDDFTFYRQDLNNLSTSLSHNAVSSICEDENGVLWIGTNGAGFNRFDRAQNQFKHYGEKDGLANNLINGILSDNKGNLWISTAKGISRFNIKEEAITNYVSKDGLQGSDFNSRVYFKSRDGEMYFGGTNGLNRFDPFQIIDNPFTPPVYITDFQILHKPVAVGFDSLWGKVIIERTITELKEIILSYNENILSFEIAALDFHSPEKNQYEYMLEGFDQHWIHTYANNRTITYTNLDPGEYTLKVRGTNNDGVWNAEGTSLRILIKPPWWATWWSYILYGFVIMFLFSGSTRFYLNRQRLRSQLQLEQEHAKKLEEVDKMKSNFYANISHEFRTPLMLILGPIEKLLSRVKDEENQKQAGLIKGNAKRLLTLINQLLDLSRLEAGKLKLKASFGNIAQFVKGLAMEFESIAERKDISLKVLMEKEVVEAYFDKEKLEKIITNLLSNAFKFTPSGGRITVKLSETSSNQVEIIIRDSGIGIPKSELTKIFDRFYQVDGSITREHEGTGIGLALTKELVELHKGNISVDSVEGHWTEVKLHFALGREHLAGDEIIDSADFEMRKVENFDEFTKEDSEAEDLLNENLIDKTIVLVVEDNPDVREYIKEALLEYYHVEEAANGEQGLRKAEKCIPDLIVSDIMMPKMDGYEMTRRIRQNDKTSHIPIILLTARSDKDSKLEGLGLGADDYLIKPFDSEELLARIKNLIETRRFLQEKFGSGATILQKPEKEKLSCLDEQFLSRVMMVIDEHLAEEEFSIEEFGKDVGMSRSQIHRKLKALTGKSTSMYLRTVRLAKAKQMLSEKIGNISEISYKVGFSSPAYFSRCFKEEFGHAPSEEK